jgi:VIT1/CCC1 family predicted Fe2+/Mn2+ transporter
VILTLIPLVGVVVAIIVCLDVARAFGKGSGFGLGLAFLSFIFFPILGFGTAQYQGPSVR